MTLLYEILSLWAPDAETPKQIATNVRRTLKALTRIDPLMAHWITFHMSDPLGKERVIDPMPDDLTPLVEEGVGRDDWGRPNPGVRGYDLWAWAGLSSNRRGTPRTVLFGVRAGSKFQNYCKFEIGSNFEPPDLNVITYPLYRSVMLATLDVWPAAWACAKCYAWGPQPAEASGDPTFPYSQYQMPWIGYLSAERTEGLVVPEQLVAKRTPTGLLMIAAEERLDPASRDHMARSKVLAEIMIERGGNPGY